jgi:hypothetical protein
LHQVGDLFELNVKLRCQKFKCHLGGLGIDGRTKLKRVFKKWDGGGINWIDVAKDELPVFIKCGEIPV